MKGYEMSFSKLNLTILCVALLLLFLGCDKNKTPTDPSSNTIFYSSFENTNDLSQWYGVWLENLRSDTPSGGGKLSAYISGYTTKPHAFSDIGPFDNDINVRLSCWAKDLFDGGVVSMRVKEDSSSIDLTITEKTWTFYESSQSLFIPKGQVLRLELNSGIAVESAVLIDLVQVHRVD
jgi:hypothetical protein